MVARDKFWIFGVRAHRDDIWLGKHDEERARKWSRITPAEGAFMLNVPNLIMVNCDGIPVPFSEDAAGYAESFRPLRRVLWGLPSERWLTDWIAQVQNEVVPG